MIKIEIYFDGEYWCARCMDTGIYTQGKSLDELFENIKEAIELHFEEKIKKEGWPEVLILSELPKHAPKITAY